jgi:nicotinamide-nucleotide amidase
MSPSVTTISIGDELLTGETLDSNSQRLAGAIVERGWMHTSHQVVGDSAKDIESAIQDAAKKSDLVLLSGGLGPTEDDVTRDGLARALGEELVSDAEMEDAIRALFSKRGYRMPESNLRQAMRPASGRFLQNNNGTAPGLLAALGKAKVIALPGPPRELVPMLAEVLDSLDEGSAPMRVRVIRACGLGESAAAERIEGLMSRDQEPQLGITVSDSILAARIRARDERTTDAELDAVAEKVRTAWHPWVFGEGEVTLQESCAELFSSRGLSIATAESCTGGLIGGMLTEVPGSSAWYRGGWITYENSRKHEDLGVPMATLQKEGAVSEATACAMAQGAAQRANTEYAISTTGIAGPDGGSKEKPVGTVWIGFASPSGVHALKFRFPGERAIVRDRTAKAALQYVRFLLQGVSAPLLWQESRS